MKGLLTRLTIFVCCITLFQGCSLHKAKKQYEMLKPPESFNHTGPESVDVSAKWWLKYKDTILNTLMDEVLEKNTDITQAYYRLEQASAYAKGKTSDLLPDISINGSGKIEDSDAYSSNVSNYSLSLAASYEIDLWGKIRSAKKAADFSREASLYDLQAMYITITSQAGELYFRALEGKEKVRLCSETVRLNQENVEIISMGYAQGITDSAALYSAKQALAGAEAELLRQHAVWKKTVHALSILQGKSPEVPDNYSLPFLAEFNEAFPAGVPSGLLKSRPDIQKVLATLKAADSEIGVAVANRFPSISLTASVGRSGTDLTGDMVSSTFSNLAGNILMPVIDWGRRKAESKRVKAKFNEMLYAYKKAVLNGFREAEDAIADYGAATGALEQMKRMTQYSGANFARYEMKYTSGLTSYASVINSKNQYIDAKKRLNEAKLDVILKNISLVRAFGGTWMTEDIKRKSEQEKG